VTGPEHFKQAEQLLADARSGTPEEPYYIGDIGPTLAAAQVHATLALAAATAMGCASEDGPPAPDWDAWREICSAAAVR
jgi:hypothetical protein